MILFETPQQARLAVVRSNALITIVATGLALATQLWPVMALLALDFAIRAFLNPRLSPASLLSSATLARWRVFADKQIYFPPKQFAARVGFLFAASITALLASGATVAATVVGALLILFASLECFLNFCVGCVVHNALMTLRGRNASGQV